MKVKRLLVMFLTLIFSFNVFANEYSMFQFEDFESVGELSSEQSSYSLGGVATIGSIGMFLIYSAYVGGVFSSGNTVLNLSDIDITYDKFNTDRLLRLTDIQVADICGVAPTSITELVKSVVQTGVITAQQRATLYPLVSDWYDKVLPVSNLIDSSNLKAGAFTCSDGEIISNIDTLVSKYRSYRWNKLTGWNSNGFKETMKDMSAKGFKYVHLLDHANYGIAANLDYPLWQDDVFLFSKSPVVTLQKLPPKSILTLSKHAYWGFQIASGEPLGMFGVTAKESGVFKTSKVIGVNDIYFYYGSMNGANGGVFIETDEYISKLQIMATAEISGLSVNPVRPHLPTAENSDLSVVLPDSALGSDYVGSIVNTGSNSDVLGGTVIGDEVITPPITGETDISGILDGLGVISGQLDQVNQGINVDSIAGEKLPTSNKFDFSPILALGTDFTNKFPFSLPFDLVRIFQMFQADPIPLVFEVDMSTMVPDSIPIAGDMNIKIDFKSFEWLLSILHIFFKLSFIVFLIRMTKLTKQG